MFKVKIENYQIYIDGQPVKKVEKLKMPILSGIYFRKKKWKKAKQ